MAKIFILEDNEALREAVASYLSLEEYEVIEFSKIAGFEEALRLQGPDLLILDVMLPDGNSFQLARKIRMYSQIPILFLTAKSSESDRITGFEIGGDDYIVKPFSNKEVVLRVRAILKRSSQEKKEPEQKKQWNLHGDVLILNGETHRLFINSEEIILTAAEWKILDYLSGNTGTVVNRTVLLGECLDYLAEGSERTIDTHIKNIRNKLGRPGWIETIRGFGYRFSGTPEAEG